MKKLNEMGKAFFEFIEKAKSNNCKVFLIMQENDNSISSYVHCDNLSELSEILNQNKQTDLVTKTILTETENKSFEFNNN